MQTTASESRPGLPPADLAARPTQPRGLELADASVLRSVRGVPAWGAVLIAVVLAALGAGADGLGSGQLGWGFGVGFVLGIAVAALAVRRGSVFTAMVQAPLVMVVVSVIALKVMNSERITFLLIKVVNAFPTMAIGAAVGLLLGLLRILAQPLRARTAVRPATA